MSTIAKGIATRLGVSAEEVLLAWAREKVAGGIVITSSTNEDRLKRYIRAGDLSESCFPSYLLIISIYGASTNF